MTDPRARQRGGWPSAGRPDDDVWGPSTAVRAGTTRPSNNDRMARSLAPPERGVSGRDGGSANGGRSATGQDDWSPAGPASREKQRANRMMERQLADLHDQSPRERGVSWWLAMLVLIAIAVIGGLIDTIGTTAARGGFNIGIVVASIVGIIIVKRSHMFPIVIAPPIVYSLAAVFQLYLRSSGLHDKKVVLDAAANYLVYGFPAIAAATAAVLIIAGIRMITRK